MVIACGALAVWSFAAAVLPDGCGFPARNEIVSAMDRRTKERPFDEKRLSRFLDYPPNATVANSAFLSESLMTPFRPNPDFWLKDVDFSCASPWNSGSGRLRAGTAVSPRHVVFSKHFALWKDVRIVFVSKVGVPSAYYIEKVLDLPECDISVGLLNAELVPDVRPAKVLPPDFAKHMGKLEGLPVVTLNQDEKAMLSEMKPTYTNSPTYRLDDFREPAAKDRKPYHVKVRSGDSGSPTFLVCDNEPILLFCQTTTIGGYGLHRFRREIQAAMDALCPGYRLESFDFAKSLSR